MQTVYEVVRVYPNKAEEILSTVVDKADIPHVVETSQFVGTWINEYRKLLRYGRGEIRIRKRIDRPTISSKATIEVDGKPAYLLNIKYGERLQWIIITANYIAGYNLLKTNELWKTYSFTRLPKLIDKELAYQCLLEYDTLIDAYNLIGCM